MRKPRPEPMPAAEGRQFENLSHGIEVDAAAGRNKVVERHVRIDDPASGTTESNLATDVRPVHGEEGAAPVSRKQQHEREQLDTPSDVQRGHFFGGQPDAPSSKKP